MNQTTAIKEYLMSGKTLTSKEAFEKFGCTRLAAKVKELRKQGHDISTIMVEGETRYGTPTRYGVYKYNK